MTQNTNTLLDDEIPEKFKDAQTGDVKTDVLLRSYKELEKKISASPSVPKDPKEYKINCNHGIFEPDEGINQRLHEKRFTNEQAQELYDLAAEKLVPIINDIMRDAQADREVEKLIQHFGGVEKWKEVSRQLLSFGQKNMPADVLDNLSSSFEGVLALHKMMKSEEPGINNQTQSIDSMNEDDLKKMMRDPKYWKEKDPAFVKKVTQGFKDIYR